MIWGDFMIKVNMLEAKTNLSKLVKQLEDMEDDVIYIARDGVEVAQITLIPKKDVSKRIGIAAGKLMLPDDFDKVFDSLDHEISGAFESEGEL